MIPTAESGIRMGLQLRVWLEPSYTEDSWTNIDSSRPTDANSFPCLCLVRWSKSCARKMMINQQIYGYEGVGYTDHCSIPAPFSLGPWRVQELSDGAWEQVELVCTERLRHVRPCLKPGQWISALRQLGARDLNLICDRHVKLHEMTKRQP